MTPEQRLEKLEQQVLRLKARLLMQSAEHLALKQLLEPLAPILTLPLHAQPMPPDSQDPSTPPNSVLPLDALYLARRGELIQRLLLQLEKIDPGLAAHVTTILDDPRQSFPVQWD